MPDLPPTPQPGEVWENDDGERRMVYCCPVDGWIWFASLTIGGTNTDRADDWRSWAIRTNARVVLQAKGEPKQC